MSSNNPDIVWETQNRLFEVIDRISVIRLNLRRFKGIFSEERKELIEQELGNLIWEKQILLDYLKLCEGLRSNRQA